MVKAHQFSPAFFWFQSPSYPQIHLQTDPFLSILVWMFMDSQSWTDTLCVWLEAPHGSFVPFPPRSNVLVLRVLCAQQEDWEEEDTSCSRQQVALGKKYFIGLLTPPFSVSQALLVWLERVWLHGKVKSYEVKCMWDQNVAPSILSLVTFNTFLSHLSSIQLSVKWGLTKAFFL